jgi:methanol--5-hydroxybenzimidazolylcobamide Co-methyltransferase
MQPIEQPTKQSCAGGRSPRPGRDFRSLAIADADRLGFGIAPLPVTTRRGVVIGAGTVHPELNFTLPMMEVSDATFDRIVEMYRTTVMEACQRALQLRVAAFSIEFETLIEMTRAPVWAARLTEVMNEVLDEYAARHGLKTVLRVCPNDLRDLGRPPRMRDGEWVEQMFETFEACARAGGEMLSIDSTGGKEICDDALMYCDLPKVIFALGVLGCRDMAFLWERIVAIAEKHGTFAAGDTACGFANTAMVLAEQQYIPRVFAALVRAASVPRSLTAYAMGAVGPGKDCGYENVFLKAITGRPMAMEGKIAACAHGSPLGNIASAACDLWSNESVQIIRLLGGPAPVVCLEQLAYDCRLMNQALRDGQAKTLRDLLVRSDATGDPQALILAPDNAIRIAQAVVAAEGGYRQTRAAVTTALAIIEESFKAGQLVLPELEIGWLGRLRETLEQLPEEESAFIDQVLPTLDARKFRACDYGLA